MIKVTQVCHRGKCSIRAFVDGCEIPIEAMSQLLLGCKSIDGSLVSRSATFVYGEYQQIFSVYPGEEAISWPDLNFKNRREFADVLQQRIQLIRSWVEDCIILDRFQTWEIELDN